MIKNNLGLSLYFFAHFSSHFNLGFTKVWFWANSVPPFIKSLQDLCWKDTASPTVFVQMIFIDQFLLAVDKEDKRFFICCS